MSKSSSLHNRLFIGMLVTGLLPVLVFLVQDFHFGKAAIEKLEKEHLTYSLRSRLLWLREWLRYSKKEFARVSDALAAELGASVSREDLARAAGEHLSRGHASYEAFAFLDGDGRVVSSWGRIPSGKAFSDCGLDLSPSPFVTTGPPRQDGEGNAILPMCRSLFDSNGHLAGYLVGMLNLGKSLKRILGDTSDLDAGGRICLVTSEGMPLFVSSGPQGEAGGLGQVPPSVLQGPHWQLRERTRDDGSRFFISAFIPEMNWVLLAEIGWDQALSESNRYLAMSALVTMLVVAGIVYLARRNARVVAEPFEKLTEVSTHIAEGNFQQRLPRFRGSYLSQVSSSFNTMLDTLEAHQRELIQINSLSAVGRLSSSIVHEMRNPLSSVKINLQALARRVADDPAYSEMAAIALRQVDRLESMLAELLRFSKPLDLQQEPVHFGKMAEQVLQTLASKASNRDIEIEVKDGLGDRPLMVDRNHMVSALVNLVDNAIEWSPAGGRVLIEARPEGDDGFVIEVCDSGPGLRPDQFGKLFQPFYTTRENGTGLGLANVKKVVEFHGGRVEAGNNPKGGACFRMILDRGLVS